MKEWQKVYESLIAHRAEIVKDVLINNQIIAVIVTKQDSPYQIGHCEVHVKTENILSAIKIIENEISFD